METFYLLMNGIGTALVPLNLALLIFGETHFASTFLFYFDLLLSKSKFYITKYLK